MQQKLFKVDGTNLRASLLSKIVQQDYQIDLTQQAWNRVIKSRGVISQMMKDPKAVIYGITTGFGSFANIAINQDQRKQLQVNLIRSHSVGVGKCVDVHIVRRMMVLRINTIAKGRSGITVETLNRIITAFNAGFSSYVPEQGTVGASGDLAPLAHLVLGLLGEGLAWDRKLQQYKPANEVLQRLQLKPVELQQKEGLTLINGTQFMASFLTEIMTKAEKLFESAIVLFAFAIQIFGMDPDIFCEEVLEQYKATNTQFYSILQKIVSYLDKKPSQLHQQRIQKHKQTIQPSSLLDAPQSLYSTSQGLKFCNKILNQQVNASTDNPLVFFKEDGFEKDCLVSAGNFHGEYVAKCGDFTALALFTLGKFSSARNARYVNGKISGLPTFLAKHGGLNSGFMIAEYVSAALLSESKLLANPSSVDSISTSACQEDHVSMGGYAARKCKLMLQNMGQILGIQLLFCLTAVDLLETKPSVKLLTIYNRIRKDIPFMEHDKFFGKDLEKSKQFVMENLQTLIQ